MSLDEHMAAALFERLEIDTVPACNRKGWSRAPGRVKASFRAAMRAALHARDTYRFQGATPDSIREEAQYR